MAKLKQEVLEEIRSNPDLFSAVAKALGIKPISLPVTLDRNGSTLNQYSIVTLVASFLGRKPADIVEKEAVKNKAKV